MTPLFFYRRFSSSWLFLRDLRGFVAVFVLAYSLRSGNLRLMGIDKFITVTEVDEGPAFADALFQRAYKKPAPDFPHHIVAFYRRADGAQVPVSYVHFTDCGDMFLA